MVVRVINAIKFRTQFVPLNLSPQGNKRLASSCCLPAVNDVTANVAAATGSMSPQAVAI
jgi:hypothetical protein